MKSSKHVHLTLPRTWEDKRHRPPAGVKLHFAAVDDRERDADRWLSLPLTSTVRTLVDLARADRTRTFVHEVFVRTRERGLLRRGINEGGVDEVRRAFEKARLDVPLLDPIRREP